jgi:hypothetical protein
MEAPKNEEKVITLKKQKLTEAEFQKKKTDLERKPGVVLVEVGENQFKTRLKG